MHDHLAHLVRRGTPSSAGYDVPAANNLILKPFSVTKIDTGLRLVIPNGHFGYVTARSSWGSKGLLLLTSIIDSDYRGSIFLTVTVIAEAALVIHEHDCIAQILILPHKICALQQTSILRVQLHKTQRGEGCLGSTNLPAKRGRKRAYDEASGEAQWVVAEDGCN